MLRIFKALTLRSSCIYELYNYKGLLMWIYKKKKFIFYIIFEIIINQYIYTYKKNLFLITGIAALVTMSFTGSSEKVELVQTEKGLSVTNMHLLSLEDLKSMEEITVVGAKTTLSYFYLDF